jgi:hypothetical protein
MTKTIEDLFIYLLFLSDILYVALFFVFFRLLKTEKALWAILLYCLLDLTVNYITEVSNSRSFVYFSYAFFTSIEYSVFSFILWSTIRQVRFKHLILVVGLCFIVFLIAYYSTTKPRSIDSIPIGIETILILLYSFYYLYEQMNDTTTLFIYSQYQFWLITGIMIYLAGSFFIYIFANQVDRQVLSNFWFLTNVFYVIKNIFFATGLLIFVKQKKINKKFQPYLN